MDAATKKTHSVVWRISVVQLVPRAVRQQYPALDTIRGLVEKSVRNDFILRINPFLSSTVRILGLQRSVLLDTFCLRFHNFVLKSDFFPPAGSILWRVFAENWW